jgi:hypothetical protein
LFCTALLSLLTIRLRLESQQRAVEGAWAVGARTVVVGAAAGRAVAVAVEHSRIMQSRCRHVDVVGVEVNVADEVDVEVEADAEVEVDLEAVSVSQSSQWRSQNHSFVTTVKVALHSHSSSFGCKANASAVHTAFDNARVCRSAVLVVARRRAAAAAFVEAQCSGSEQSAADVQSPAGVRRSCRSTAQAWQRVRTCRRIVQLVGPPSVRRCSPWASLRSQTCLSISAARALALTPHEPWLPSSSPDEGSQGSCCVDG